MSNRVSAAASSFQDRDVTLDLDSARAVSAFLAGRKRLKPEQCLTLVEEAILLLEGLYVHLPLKRAMYAVDPVRRLKLLKLRLESYCTPQRPLSQPWPQDDLWFHREMTDTLTSVRDLHTMYVLPKPFDRAVAFVPFQIEDYFDKPEDGERKYVVSNVITGLDWFKAAPGFMRGVEVTHWNDVPMSRAVELAGARNAGSNPDARLARGLARLTIRPLAKALPPDEECVTVRYVSEPDKVVRCLRVPWRVATLPRSEELPRDGATIHDMAEGFDYETDLIRTLNKRVYSKLYSTEDRTWGLCTEEHGPSRDSKGITEIKPVDVVDEMRDVLDAKRFRYDGKRFGYIRLRTFQVDHDALAVEFARLAESMPEDGLIVDIRDNPGGSIQSGERLLQILTPRTVQPEPGQFINTSLSLKICEALPDSYGQWGNSIRRAVETGTTFSSAFPLSDPAFCNDMGQRYYGPVVLITNALCYSTADIFAAGFQDHEIGPVLGTDGCTGAGGADVVAHSQLRERLKQVEKARGGGASLASRPLRELPAGDLRFALRRTLRVGARAGTELEDLGVTPKFVCRMTRDDVLDHNIDLIRCAADALKNEQSYDLREIEGTLQRREGQVAATIRTRNFDRLDIFVDDRDDMWASPSMSVPDGDHPVFASLLPGGRGTRLNLRGYDKKGKLVAARKIQLP